MSFPVTGLSRRGLFAVVLVGWGCASSPESRALPPLPRGVTVTVAEENFDVTGRTVEEIGLSLTASASSALGPGLRGQHRWNIVWGYRASESPASCTIVSLPIDMNSRIVLPRWTERDGADPDLVAMWDEYITALRSHEFTHREHAYLAVRDLSRGLRRASTPICGTLDTLVRTTSQQIFEEYEERDRVFDEESLGQFDWPPHPSG